MNQYKNKIQKQFLVMLGLVVVSLVITASVMINDFSESTQGFMCGLTGSFIVIEILLTIRYVLILRNPEKLKAAAIKESDERNQLINQKVQAVSFNIFIFILAIITIVMAFIDADTMMILGNILWVSIFVKLIVYIYYKRKL